jgi:prepilin-type N-terminal cleavage/methylation domain-containing protein
MKKREQKTENGLPAQAGFTLIETLVAISLLMLALVAPMSLAAQSLAAAYYSRSQITGFYLAQEGIEVVRSVRDANIITEAEGGTLPVNQGGAISSVFDNIPAGTTVGNSIPFTVDSLQGTSNAIFTCPSSGCPPLLINSAFSEYGYGDNGSTIGTNCTYSPASPPSSPWPSWVSSTCTSGKGWNVTLFKRTVRAYLVNASNPRELRVSVTVSWTQGALAAQSFTINEDLYAWISGS